MMTTLYLTEERALVRRDSEDCLLVQIPERRDNNGTITPASKRRIPLVKVEQVVVMGDVTMTTPAISLLLDKQVEIQFLDVFGLFKGRLSPSLSKNSLLRLAQHRAYNDIGRRCELARRFVIGKLSNQRTLLQRTQRRQSKPIFQQEIEQMAQCIRQLTTLPLTPEMPASVLSNGEPGIAGTALETILGLEGAGSAAYFRRFGALLADQHQWPFAGR